MVVAEIVELAKREKYEKPLLTIATPISHNILLRPTIFIKVPSLELLGLCYAF